MMTQWGWMSGAPAAPRKTAHEALDAIARAGERWLISVDHGARSALRPAEPTWGGLGSQLEDLARADPAHCEELGLRWIASVEPSVSGKWAIDVALELGRVALAIAEWVRSEDAGKPWRAEWTVETQSSYESDDEGGEREEMRTQVHGRGPEPVAPEVERVWRGFCALVENYEARHQECLSAEEAMAGQVGNWGVWSGAQQHEALRAVGVAVAYHEEVVLGASAAPAKAAKAPPRM